MPDSAGAMPAVGAFEGLILLFMGARLAVQPFIVPAAGDLQQSA